MNPPGVSQGMRRYAAAPANAAHQVQCDLCELPMDVPRHCIERGGVFGMLTCSACVEDSLSARQLEIQP